MEVIKKLRQVLILALTLCIANVRGWGYPIDDCYRCF